MRFGVLMLESISTTHRDEKHGKIRHKIILITLKLRSAETENDET